MYLRVNKLSWIRDRMFERYNPGQTWMWHSPPCWRLTCSLPPSAEALRRGSELELLNAGTGKQRRSWSASGGDHRGTRMTMLASVHRDCSPSHRLHRERGADGLQHGMRAESDCHPGRVIFAIRESSRRACPGAWATCATCAVG